VEIRKALQECMQHNFSVFREGDAMAKGLEQLKVIRERLKNARLDDTSSEFNTQRVECLELDNLMETAFAAMSANFRTEAVARIAASTSRIVMTKTGCAIPCICQSRNP
jgi:succinate dehydrogenase / fumarate reductase flavoprotein subunit